MKVVYYTPTGMIGGAEMCLIDLLETVRVRRPDWDLRLLLGDDGPLASVADSLGVRADLIRMPASLTRLGDAGLGQGGGVAGKVGLATRGLSATWAIGRYVSKLRRVFRQLAPDLLQTNGMKSHLLGTWSAPRKIPVVWHIHDYLSSRAVMGKLLRKVVRSGVHGVGVSRSVTNDAAGVLGPKVPVRTIYNAVDTDRFTPTAEDPESLDRASGLPPAPSGTIRVGLVATFAVWKGHSVFLDAASRVSTDLPVRFYIVGGPIYRSAGSQVDLDALRAEAERLGLDGRIGFTGHQADPASVLRALDVVVHASTRPEPFGRVITEGMACGKAVIAVKQGGAAELFEDGVDALGCAPGDAVQLAERIERLVRDAELRRQLGAAARRSVLARFDRSRLADQWGQLYESIVPDG